MIFMKDQYILLSKVFISKVKAFTAKVARFGLKAKA